jgi:mRNA interferase MazF
VSSAVPESPRGRAEPRARRGQVVLVELRSPEAAGIVSGRRPCVVIQNDVGNDNSPHTIVAPIAERSPDDTLYPVNVVINWPEGGVRVDSYIDCGQLFTIPWDHIERVLGQVTTKTQGNIDRALRISLHL